MKLVKAFASPDPIGAMKLNAKVLECAFADELAQIETSDFAASIRDADSCLKNLGITGHYRPDALIDCIHRHPFDCILMSLNPADVHMWSFQEKLLPLAVEKQMGIIGMKVPSRGRLLSSWTPPPVISSLLPPMEFSRSLINAERSSVSNA